MRAGIYNFTIEQGAKFERFLTWRDQTKTPRDLTGYDARMKIKRKIGGPLILSLTSNPPDEGDGIYLGGATGVVQLFISSETTTALDFKTAVYDLELVPPVSVDPKREPIRWIEGALSFSPEATD